MYKLYENNIMYPHFLKYSYSTHSTDMKFMQPKSVIVKYDCL